MLTEALTHMLTRLGQFLPPPADDLPVPVVSVVRLEEKTIGLGRFHALTSREHFPVAHKGVRLAGTVRFQLWGGGPMPTPVEQQLRLLTEAVLGDREALEAEGFVDLRLTGVSTSDHLDALPAWRQTADFDVLYEFRREATDDAGGLIARIPVALADAWGSLVSEGDIVIWNSDGTPPLVMTGRRDIHGLSSLAFLPGTIPAGTVTLERTSSDATGAPEEFTSLDEFLSAVSGPTPASVHARVSVASLDDFLTDLGTPGDPLQLVDENGAPRDFAVRGRAFTPPIALPRQADRLTLAIDTPHLDTPQVLYLRAARGPTSSP